MFLAIFHQLKKNICWKGKLLKGIVLRDEYILSDKKSIPFFYMHFEL
jgi:hypothetical protein